MPINPVDEDIVLGGKVRSDFNDIIDWSRRVISPLGTKFQEIPDRGFDPFSENMPTRDRYYDPSDMKRRVFNPINEQQVSYVPDGKEDAPARQTLNEWADEADLEGRVPNWNEPMPIEITPNDPDKVGNLDTEIDNSGRVKEFSRPLVKQGRMNLGGPTDRYEDLPRNIREQIEKDYPGKPSNEQGQGVVDEAQQKAYQEHRAKAYFYPEELEQMGMDPESTDWYFKEGDAEWQKLPPRSLPVPRFDQPSGDKMSLGGPTGEEDNPYLPAGFGDEPTNDELLFMQKPNDQLPEGFGVDTEIIKSPYETARDSIKEAVDLYKGVAEKHGHLEAMTGPARALYHIGKDLLTTLYTGIEQLGSEGYDPGDSNSTAIPNAFNVASAFASGGFARGAMQKTGTNELGMFGGKMTTGPMNKTRQYAEDALKRGEDPQAVKEMTGWYKNESGQMEFVIDPKDLKLRPEPEIYGMDTKSGRPVLMSPLASLVEHPTLFKEFPELATNGFVELSMDIKRGEAQYLYENGRHVIKIHADPDDPNWLATMAHEINHGLQEINDFPRGADYVHLAKTVRQNLKDFTEGAKESQLDYPVVELLQRQYPNTKITEENARTWLRSVRDSYSNDWPKTLAALSQNIGMDLYHRSAGEVKSRLSQSLLELSKGEIREMDMAKAGDVPVKDRIFDYTTQEQGSLSLGSRTAANENFKEIETISTNLVSKLRSVQEGLSPSKAMGPVEAEISKLEKRVREMEGKGRKVVAEDVANWLEMAGVEGINIKEASTGTKYVSFPDPTARDRVGRVRVADDQHVATYAKPNEIDTGNVNLDPKSSPSETKKRLKRASNEEGGSYSVWENLVDALKWKLSKSPDGQWLISPGKETRAKAAKAENTGDTISKDPNQLEFEYMFPQPQQQQQGRGPAKITTPDFDAQLVEMHRSGMSYEAIGKAINEDRKAKLLDPISSKTLERRIKEYKKLRDEFVKRFET